MATKILHHVTLHDIEGLDGDTIAAWLDFDGIVRVKRRIRLQGIEAGELHEARGLAAKQFLAAVVLDRILHTAILAGGMRREDQHGRLVADVVFDTGETLCQLCLGSGRYWRRHRNGTEDKAPQPPKHNNTP
jgi:endonuclease YncB( thermonuclease family)